MTTASRLEAAFDSGTEARRLEIASFSGKGYLRHITGFPKPKWKNPFKRPRKWKDSEWYWWGIGYAQMLAYEKGADDFYISLYNKTKRSNPFTGVTDGDMHLWHSWNEGWDNSHGISDVEPQALNLAMDWRTKVSKKELKKAFAAVDEVDPSDLSPEDFI